VDAFRRLIAANPRSYKGYDNLGLCYEALGKPDEAVTAFKRAQELARAQDPSYDWPYANLAEMLIKQDRSEEALSYAQEATRIDPRSARNQYLVGKALSRAPDLHAPLPYLLKATQLDPNYAEPHYLLGQLYQKLGRHGDAGREFAAFEEISKRTPHVKQ
jgi:tetratricopeptide (TPR) repeat protein